jgi:hypothetical protein
MQTDVPNLDASPSEVRGYGSGHGIKATPRAKGTYRVYDLRFIHTTNDGAASDLACVAIGGEGCARLYISHVETENIKCGYRFTASIDEFIGMRLSAHPWNDGAVFADTDAAVSGTWFNPKWEAPGVTGSVVFDNSDTSDPAAVVEPWPWGGDQSIELWRGTKPRQFPDTDTRVASAFWL